MSLAQRVRRGALVALLAWLACKCGSSKDADPVHEFEESVRVGNEAAALAALDRAAESARLVASPSDRASRLEEAAERIATFGSDASTGRAQALLEEALVLRERDEAKGAELARTLTLLAEVEYGRGQLPDAERKARRALELYQRQLGPAAIEALTGARGLATILLDLGRYAEASSLAEQTLALPNSPASERAEMLNVLGEARRVQGRFDNSRARFREAIEVAQNTPGINPLLLAALYNNLAGLFKDEGDFASAEPPLRSSLEIRERLQPIDLPAVALAILNLGDLRRLQGRYRDADSLLTKALEKAQGALPDDSPRLVWFLSQLAELRREQGDSAEAETMLRDCLARRERSLPSGHPDIGQSEEDLGELLQERGRTAEAATHLRRALEIRTRAFGEKSAEMAVSAAALARALLPAASGVSNESRALVDRAIESLRSTRAFPDAYLSALRLRAEILRRSGRRADARRDLEDAMLVAETLRPRAGAGESERADLWRRRLDLFHTAVLWHVEDGDPAGALLVAERARARVFLDQLEAAHVDPHSLPRAIREPLERRKTDAEARLVEYRARLAAAHNGGGDGVAELERELERASAELEGIGEEWRAASADTAKTPPTSRDAGHLARSLAGRGVALVYQVGIQQGVVFVVHGSGRVDVARLNADEDSARRLGIPSGPVGAAALERIVAAPGTGLRAALMKPSAETSRGFGSLLDPDSASTIGEAELLDRLEAFAKVILPEPVRAAAASSRDIVVVPDGLLNLVPFEALVLDRKDGAPVFALDLWPPLRYAPSGSVLELLAARSAARSQSLIRDALLTIADPALGSSSGAPATTEELLATAATPWDAIAAGLPRLPHTRDESERVAAAAGRAGRVVRLLGADASEAALRAEVARARVLHFATHGIASESEGSVLAGLVLAPGSGAANDDGLLLLHEVYGLDLASDLVVLSACSTQIGRRVDGEGVFSLARAFLSAGADRVVATLWPVGDRTTSEIVGTFFEALDRRSPDYAAALRAAKLGVRRDPKRSHPFFWAGITLTGTK